MTTNGLYELCKSEVYGIGCITLDPLSAPEAIAAAIRGEVFPLWATCARDSG